MPIAHTSGAFESTAVPAVVAFIISELIVLENPDFVLFELKQQSN